MTITPPTTSENCKHEPDAKTIEVKKGIKRAHCIHCGIKIIITNWYRRPEDPSQPAMKITSSDRREAKRRNHERT